MGAGYFIAGLDKGLQFGMQYELSKNNMELLRSQIDVQQQTLNLKREDFEYKKTVAMERSRAYKAQFTGLGGQPLSREQVRMFGESIMGNSVMSIGKDSDNYLKDVSRLGQMADLRDEKGEFMLTSDQRFNIKSFVNNPRYHGLVQYAEGLKSEGNDDMRKRYHAELVSDPQTFKTKYNLTQEQYNNVAKAFDIGGAYTPEMAFQEGNFQGWIKGLQIQKGVPQNVNITDIDNKIMELENLWNNKQVSDSFYRTNAGNLKAYAMKMEMAKVGYAPHETTGGWFSKQKHPSVAGATIGLIDGVIPRSKKTDHNSYAERYDMRMVINNALQQYGIDPSSTMPTDVQNAQKIANVVLANYLRNDRTYSRFIMKDDDLSSPATRELVVARADSELRQTKLEEVIGFTENTIDVGTIPKQTTRGESMSPTSEGTTFDQLRAFRKRQTPTKKTTEKEKASEDRTQRLQRFSGGL